MHHHTFSRDGYGPSKPSGIRRSRSESGKRMFDEAHLLPIETLFSHIRNWQDNGDKDARDAAMLANLRLVKRIAGSYLNRGLDFEDILDHGIFGLMRAIDKFDCSYGTRFSTYASRCIKQHIARGIVNESRAIRIPVHQWELAGQIGKFSRTFHADCGTNPTPEEIAQGIGIPVGKVVRCIGLARSAYVLSGEAITESLEKRGHDGSALILDPEEMQRARDMLARERRLYHRYPIALAMLDIPAGKREIFRRYLGLNGYPACRNLKEIGDEIGLTRERVRQIMNEVAKKLEREHAAWWDYKWYLGHDARVEALERIIG